MFYTTFSLLKEFNIRFHAVYISKGFLNHIHSVVDIALHNGIYYLYMNEILRIYEQATICE